MGGCKSSNTTSQDLDGVNQPVQQTEQRGAVNSSNPFYDIDSLANNEQSILSKYRFHSKYNDNFIGKCCQLQQISTGNIYLSKQFVYTNEDKMKQQRAQFQNRKDSLTCENVIQIKDLISTQVDGFFRDKHKIIVIMDYPFINFSKQISNRLSKQINFSQEELFSFVTSTIRGYTNIQQAGYKTDKVRLKNIFFGIKNKESIIKVAESSLITPKSNYEYFYEGGPNKSGNKDLYLAPEQLQAWKNGQKDYETQNKSGVFALGMCILDLVTMDPSRECYFFTEKDIDIRQIQNRIEIAGKKYGGGLQRLLRQMLEIDIHKRSTFEQINQQLPSLTKNQQSKMNISLIPSQRTSIINNDNTNLKSSKMFKSVVSQQNNSGSRVFSSRIKSDRKDQQLDNVMQNYTNGNKYTGQKKGDLKHGKGKYTFRDGSYYEGDWDQNKISGVGNLYFCNGKIQYSGQWRNDEFNGWGTLNTEDDKQQQWQKYEGEFKNGVKQGRGKMYFKDGTVYDGQFKGGKICGRGRKISPNGQIKDKYWQTISPAFFLSS